MQYFDINANLTLDWLNIYKEIEIYSILFNKYQTKPGRSHQSHKAIIQHKKIRANPPHQHWSMFYFRSCLALNIFAIRLSGLCVRIAHTTTEPAFHRNPFLKYPSKDVILHYKKTSMSSTDIKTTWTLSLNFK